MAKVKCKFCGERNEKDIMECVTNVTSGGNTVRKYFCKECKKLLDSRDLAIDKFYEYTKSLCLKKEVFHAFKQLKLKGLNEHDILYIMEYVIKTKSVLNYPMGLSYYMDRAMKQKKKDEMRQQDIKKIKVKIPIKTIKVEDVKIDKQAKKSKADISEFLDWE